MHVQAVAALWRCLFQLIVRVVYTALIYRDRYAQFELYVVVDTPVMAQMRIPMVFEILQLQYID